MALASHLATIFGLSEDTCAAMLSAHGTPEAVAERLLAPLPEVRLPPRPGPPEPVQNAKHIEHARETLGVTGSDEDVRMAVLEEVCGPVLGPDETEASVAAEVEALGSGNRTRLYHDGTYNTLADLLRAAEVPFSLVDLSHDYELASWVRSKAGKLPAVFVQSRPLGDLTGLAPEKIRARVLETECAEADKDEAASPPPLGMVDKALEGVEALMRSLNPLQWWRKEAPQANTGEEVSVVHTNWYWRHLPRRLHFLDTAFLRIHPRVGDVRAAHAYAEVSRVVRASTTQLRVEYGSGTAPDLFQASEADTQRMLALFQERAPHAACEDLLGTACM